MWVESLSISMLEDEDSVDNSSLSYQSNFYILYIIVFLMYSKNITQLALKMLISQWSTGVS